MSQPPFVTDEPSVAAPATGAAEPQRPLGEPRYQAVVESVPDVIAMVDPAGLIRFVNPAVERVLGWPPEALVGQSAVGMVHPEDAGLAMERLRARFAGRTDERISTWRFRTRDGGWRHMEARAELLAAGPDDAPVMVVNLRDVTEREERGRRLVESERRMRQLFDSVGQFLMLLDAEGRVLEISAAALREGGVPPEAALGLPLWQLPGVESIAATARTLEAAVRAAATGHGVTHGEFTYRNGSGALRSARFTITPLGDEADAPAFLLCEAFDITEQRRAEQALQESERLFKGIAEQSPSIISLYDVRDAVHLYVNAAFEQMLDRSAAELVGGPGGFFGALVVPEDRAVAEALLARCDGAADDETVEGEFRLLHREESSRVLAARMVVFSREPNGAPRLVLVLLNDVTERRALEARLRQSDKMEALGTLAGGVAHDFNNVLSVIMNYAELVAATLPPEGPQADDMAQVLAASRRARDLVRQILAFSRKSEIAREVFALRTVVEETQRFLRASLPASVRLRERCTGIPCLVEGDAGRIQQVLINLAVNAEYAMRATGGGTIEFLLDAVALDATAAHEFGIEAGAFACLQVRDDGPGMSAEVLARVFEPFFTTKPVGEGTGMGLAAAHGIVSLHGGGIRATSAPGRGTTFTILLPLAEASAAAAGADAPRPATVQDGASRPARILVVDDEPAIARVTGKVLARFGFEAVVTTDPREALSRFRDVPDAFDCLVTDLTMPHIPGNVLARECLALRPGLPVILCTGFSADVTRESAESLGIAAYLDKPVEPADLVRTIRSVLGRA